jgi:hypothetical protein
VNYHDDHYWFLTSWLSLQVSSEPSEWFGNGLWFGTGLTGIGVGR